MRILALSVLILIEVLSTMLCNAYFFSRYSKLARNVVKNVRLKNMSTVKVTTYNVLSSSLSEPGYFRACSPEHLHPPTRLEKLRKKLQAEIDNRSIICLQELSEIWTGELADLFTEHNYHLMTASYGSKFDGYMGVAIAFPTDVYELNKMDITRISDTKNVTASSSSVPKKPEGFVAETIDKVGRMWRSIVEIWSGRRKPVDDNLWDLILKRHNRMICLNLKCKESQKSFVVGTYHMPCAFRTPAVMVVHSALSAQHIHKLANGLPYLYVGDFNVKPHDPSYRLLTEGSLASDHPQYPQIHENDTWTPTLEASLRSAYNTSLGSEPDFTNYAKVLSEPEFIETLDYIFHSQEWTVNEVRPLPHRSEVTGPLPNEDEPSDHILLSATLSLPERS